MDDDEVVEKCKIALRRIYWRMMYYEKKRRNIECQFVSYLVDKTHHYELEEQIYLTELLNLLEKKVERNIIRKIIIDGHREWEVAQELNISQQAVNKCKKKCLAFLQTKMHP